MSGYALVAFFGWLVAIGGLAVPRLRRPTVALRMQTLVVEVAGNVSEPKPTADPLSKIGRVTKAVFHGTSRLLVPVFPRQTTSGQTMLAINDRTLGILVLLALSSLALDVRVSLVVVMFGLAATAIRPKLSEARQRKADQIASEAALPHLIDIVRACVLIGTLPRHVLVGLHRNVRIDSLGYFASYFADLAASVESGQPFAETLNQLKAAGPNIVAFVAALQWGEPE